MKMKTDLSVKPYNKCLSCHHRGVRCDGPRTSSLELAQWCEFMRDMKNVSGLTNADIAERSGVSIKTIERLMALNSDQDIMRETARRIEDAIIESSNQNPCYLAFEETMPQDTEKLNEAMRELERALDDNNDYREALDKIHLFYKEEMQLIREEAQKKIDFLLDHVNRLSRENDNLWAENNRKAKVVDMFLEKQNVLLTLKKE